VKQRRRDEEAERHFHQRDDNAVEDSGAKIAARPGAGEVPRSMLVGGAKALAPMIVEFVFSAVNRMNAKGDPDGRNSKQDDPEDHEHRIETSLPMWK
jgi:hypothetical protein